MRLFFIVLACSLQPIYFYNIGLAPFPLLGGFLGIIDLPKRTFSSLNVRLFLAMMSVCIIWVLIGLLNSSEATSYSFPQLVGFMLIFIFGLGFYALLNQSTNSDLSKILGYVLMIHIILFTLQLSYFMYSGTRLDYLKYLTGEEQRIGANKLKEFSSMVVRGSGIYSEPGTYSTYIFMLGMMRIYLKRSFDLLYVLSLLSMLLTFSITGIVGAVYSFMMSAVFLKSRLSKLSIPYILLFISFFYVLFGDIFLGPILDRILLLTQGLGNDGSAQQRFVEGSVEFLRSFYRYTGVGIGPLYKQFESINLIGRLFTRLGFLGLSILSIILIVLTKNISKLILLLFISLPVLLSNADLNHVMIVFFFVFLSSTKRHDNCMSTQ